MLNLVSPFNWQQQEGVGKGTSPLDLQLAFKSFISKSSKLVGLSLLFLSDQWRERAIDKSIHSSTMWVNKYPPRQDYLLDSSRNKKPKLLNKVESSSSKEQSNEGRMKSPKARARTSNWSIDYSLYQSPSPARQPLWRVKLLSPYRIVYLKTLNFWPN